MTAGPSIDPTDLAAGRTLEAGQFLHDQLAQASPDLMRDLLTTFVNALLGAEADAVCGTQGDSAEQVLAKAKRSTTSNPRH